MSDSNKEKQESGFEEAVIKIVVAFGIMALFTAKITVRGIMKLNYKDSGLCLLPLCWMTFAMLLTYLNFAHLRILSYLVGDAISQESIYSLAGYGIWTNVLVIFVLGMWISLFLYGLRDLLITNKIESAIKTTGLKNGLQVSPKVKKIIRVDDDRKMIRIECPGVPASEWKTKKDGLESALRSHIDDIVTSSDMRYIDIFTSGRDLPRFVDYKEVEAECTESFTFIVGQSKTGLVTQSIRECPHFLMGGSTGMGKSTAFKLMLYSILKNTPSEQIHLSLLDLKRGIEVADFRGFPNVEISKTESEALKTLREVVKEMHRRYEWLAKKERKSLNPGRDKVPIIVVAIDEASVIFGTGGRSTENRKMANQARGYCEDIGKLGRAAGIHLILATQRATKTSIDTVTMDNLNARMSFRTRSVSGSNAILGDKRRAHIPDIKGRAIWQIGTEDRTVQVPYLSESELSERCQVLSESVSEEIDGKKLFSLNSKKELLSEILTDHEGASEND